MSKDKIIRLLPFMILCVLDIITWIRIIIGSYGASIKHQLALIFLLINLITYFLNFRLSVLLTGVVLILLTFNFLAVTLEISATSFYIGLGKLELSTPHIQGWSLLILIVYLCINLKYIVAFSGAMKR